MAVYNKYQDFVDQLLRGVHVDFRAAGSVLKVALTNTAPNAATHTVLADFTEIAGGNGYTAGGTDVQNDMTEAAGTATVTGVDVVWTASGGTIGPFRYVGLYNDTPVAPADPLISWWDYGSAITLQIAETFTVDFGASVFTLASFPYIPRPDVNDMKNVVRWAMGWPRHYRLKAEPGRYAT